MELIINSPSYYTQVYGIDDEIYWMCRKLTQYFKEKEYSDYIKSVGIVPIVAPVEVIENGLGKEHKRVELKAGFASVFLQMDFQKYVDADINKKKAMLIDNLLRSIKAIKSRAKFDYKSFENDIKTFCINNHIIFGIDKFEEELFEHSVYIANSIALEKWELLIKKGFLREFSKDEIISILKAYGGKLSIIDKNNYGGEFTYSMHQENITGTELDLVIDGVISDLVLSCEFAVENNEFAGVAINGLRDKTFGWV